MIDARKPEPGETYTALSGHVYRATEGRPQHRASCPCWKTGGVLDQTRVSYLRHFTGQDLRPASVGQSVGAGGRGGLFGRRRRG